MVNAVDKTFLCIGMRNVTCALVISADSGFGRYILGKPARAIITMPDAEYFVAHCVIFYPQYFRNIAAAAQRALLICYRIAHARQRKQSFS